MDQMTIATRAEAGEDAALLLRDLYQKTFPPVRSRDHTVEECETADLRAFRFFRMIGAEAYVDAAMMLIAPNTFYHISQFSEDGGSGAEAHVYPNRNVGDDYAGEGPTPAHALIAAIDRASALQPTG